MGKWLNNLVLPYQRISALKSNELLIHAITWVDLKGIMMSGGEPISKSYILYDSIYVTVSK